MLKKIMPILLVTCSLSCTIIITGCSDTSSQDSKNFTVPILATKETALKSITYAVMYDKSELFWNCLSEESQIFLLSTAKQMGKTEEAAKQEFFQGFQKDFKKIMIKHGNNPEHVVLALSAGNFFPMEQINGKWYYRPEGIVKRGNNTSVDKYSDKMVLTSDFVTGIIGSNYDLVWNCLSVQMQEKVKKERGGKNTDEEEIKKRFVNDMKPVIDKELEKNNYDADKTISAFSRKSSIIKIGNRWFYQAE